MTTIENATLTPVGDRLALMIDDSTLELMGIDAKTPLRVQTDGRSLVISLQNGSTDSLDESKFQAAVRTMLTRYETTFRKLAE
jgi:hypothetical protein